MKIDLPVRSDEGGAARRLVAQQLDFQPIARSERETVGPWEKPVGVETVGGLVGEREGLHQIVSGQSQPRLETRAAAPAADEQGDPQTQTANDATSIHDSETMATAGGTALHGPMFCPIQMMTAACANAVAAESSSSSALIHGRALT